MDDRPPAVSAAPVRQGEPGGSLRWFLGFLVVATVALSVLVVLLARQNRELKTQLAAQVAAPEPTPVPSWLWAGQELPALPGIDQAGAPATLTFGGDAPASLALVISGSCGHCEAAMKAWGRQIERVSNSKLRIVCIQIDAPSPKYFQKLEHNWPMFGAALDTPVWTRQLPIIPVAILLDARGKITHTWLGEMDPKQEEEFMFALIGAGADVPEKAGG